ncbi:MAG: LysR family transcriptional regulator [Bacteroidetes bacterium]|nr:MAG: LysR family transcriptional regulator [Bacteroidota bacterium]
MNYTLNQLRVFAKIVELGSITKASEELHLTQPAVSIQLKNLQDQFEIPLTEVIGRKIYITDFGKEIASAAQSILQQVDEINYKTLQHKGQVVGKLKLSVVSTGKYVMPYFLTDFLNESSGVDLIMDVTNKATVIKHLENNDVDYALVSVLPKNIAVENIPLMENRLYLVGRKTNETPAKIKLKTLENLPLIYREQGSATRQVMEKFLSDNDIHVLKKMELTSNEAVKQAVLAGLGFSIMPLIGIKNELKNGELTIIEVKGLPIITNWNLIWLKDKKFSPAAEAYKVFLQNNKSNIISKQFEWFRNK